MHRLTRLIQVKRIRQLRSKNDDLEGPEVLKTADREWALLNMSRHNSIIHPPQQK